MNKNIKSAEFASRWKKETSPGSISRGKETARYIAEDVKNGMSKLQAKANQLDAIKVDRSYSENEKNRFKNSKNKGSFKELYNRKSKEKSSPQKLTTPSQEDILKTKKQKLLDAINDDLNEAKKKVADKPPKFEPPKFDYKFPKKPSRVSQLGKLLLKNKGKIALLAGAGALGAVGYGLYRKARSDKGKKRRFYNK